LVLFCPIFLADGGFWNEIESLWLKNKNYCLNLRQFFTEDG